MMERQILEMKVDKLDFFCDFLERSHEAVSLRDKIGTFLHVEVKYKLKDKMQGHIL